jgi:glyoxylase-like metal-dependent hydrolase (beta-lactamase superfamily II)
MEDSDLPEGLEITRLDGHSFAMIGVKTPDDVWFLADSLTSRATLEKFHIPFLRDITNHLKTLLKVELLEGALFIPSHVNPMKDVRHLVEINRSKILEIIDKILSICKTPSSTEDVLKDLFDSYRLVMDINQYMLAGCSVRSFLSHLHGSGEIRLSFSDNRLMWETA